MFDLKSVVYGAIYYGNKQIFFQRDRAYALAWYRDEKTGTIVRMGWLEDGDLRSLQAAGLKTPMVSTDEASKFVAGGTNATEALAAAIAKEQDAPSAPRPEDAIAKDADNG